MDAYRRSVRLHSRKDERGAAMIRRLPLTICGLWWRGAATAPRDLPVISRITQPMAVDHARRGHMSQRLLFAVLPMIRGFFR